MKLDIAKSTIRGLASYLYNTSTYDVVRAIFPDAHESCIDEKVQTISKRGIATFLGFLDEENFSKFCQNVADYTNKHEIV